MTMTREDAKGLLMRCEAESYCGHYLQKFNCDGCKQRTALDMAIEALQTDVVRCEDCKYLGIKDFVYGYCKKNMVGEIRPDDFCSYGERRQKK